jgi:hypothetical protein
MTRRPTLLAIDPLQILHPLRLRQSDPDTFTRNASRFRIAPAAAGLLASLIRRRQRHARVRTWEAEGLLVRGDDEAESLAAEAAQTCVQALREAACLAAEAPVACGSFGLDGITAHVEISACHDGARAFVHIGEGDDLLSDPLLALIDEADIDAFQELHGASMPPEDFLALRRGARWADLGNLLVRHCDVTLLAASRGSVVAPRLLALLHQAMSGCVQSSRWRLAVEPMAECRRFCGIAEPAAAAPVRTASEAWWRSASPPIQAALRAAAQASMPLLPLDSG